MNGNRPVRVAIPYYGLLIRPGSGIERIYFLADLAAEEVSPERSRMCVWNPNKDEDLAAWLKAEQVEQIVCRQCPPALCRELESTGIRVLSPCQGKLDKRLKSCLAEIAA